MSKFLNWFKLVFSKNLVLYCDDSDTKFALSMGGIDYCEYDMLFFLSSHRERTVSLINNYIEEVGIKPVCSKNFPVEVVYNLKPRYKNFANYSKFLEEMSELWTDMLKGKNIPVFDFNKYNCF